MQFDGRTCGMRIELERTFSIPRDDLEESGNWLEHLRKGKGELSWSDLHQRNVVVVIGEAGIGKTVEFENEALRLQREGKAAFLVALNQVLDKASWELAIETEGSRYAEWEKSSALGYFFLDAVDEARLVSHSAFQVALRVIHSALRKHMARVRVAISSRVTDWAIEGVREAVHQHLVLPIGAQVRTDSQVDASLERGTGDTVRFQAEAASEPGSPFVVSLDPLSETDARRLANAFRLTDAAAFWEQVDDGNFEFMATRPLDLEWMVRLWNEKRRLGTYLELVDGNVLNRLTEANPSYQTTRAAPSLEQLRVGAEQLAAAAEFSNRAFVSVSMTSGVRLEEVDPLEVLSDWKGPDISRLLASAIFDEATFGRVKFHHRSIREYLAASWVSRQLGAGLPLHRVLQLFSARPFDALVLMPTRRATLCWLAALNVEAREWVTRTFPEMLFFEGDPEAWDDIAADRAFSAYLDKRKKGWSADWINDASELRRVARRLPLGRVAALLVAQPPDSDTTRWLLPLVKHGRLADCAAAVFGIYRNPKSSIRSRQYALLALSAVGAAEHRDGVRDDLMAGDLCSNELVTAALGVINWQALGVDALAKILQAVRPESTYETSRIVNAIKDDLLPAVDADTAELLLTAIIAALPALDRLRQGTEVRQCDQPDGTWLLGLLPDCLERLLTLLPASDNSSEICLEAGERIEIVRGSGIVDQDDLGRLRALIVDRPAIRWSLALRIAKSKYVRQSLGILTWGEDRLVSFSGVDLPELTARANDAATEKDVRDIWFEVAMSLAYKYLTSRKRSAALHELRSGPDGESRAVRISVERGGWTAAANQRRKFHHRNRGRKRTQALEHGRNRELISADLEHIRDGTSRRWLRWLVGYSFDHGGRENLTSVDFELISKDFGVDVSEALRLGLIEAWPCAETANPADYSNGTVPWEAITALAGLNGLVGAGRDIALLTSDDAARAAKLAVWELNKPPSWFERLAQVHEVAIGQALLPWVEADVLAPAKAGDIRRALELCLRCPSAVRRRLLQPLIPHVLGGQVVDPSTVESLIGALQEERLIDAEVFSDLCKARVTRSLNAEGRVSGIDWLRRWFKETPLAAWQWFEDHLSEVGAAAGAEVDAFARSLVESDWIRMPASDTTIDILVRMYRLLDKFTELSAPSMASGEPRLFGQSISQLREAIPRVLVHTPGRAANEALVRLAAEESDVRRRGWLEARVLEHAALQAQLLSQFEGAALKAIAVPFLTNPRSEGQLFQQVVARLEEIRKTVEEGPFSDRDLFRKGIPEKHLQRWLAARFRDTPHRRFSIHREEEVDANNQTDIQLSCQYGNVCVEVKPLDASRTYSASTLVDTLRTQIVEKYLKGYNSSHGILVLFRLDEKLWDIPGRKRGCHFVELVAYLEEQAAVVRGESRGVQELMVVGINCLL
jgi:hypothetical protein